MYKILLAISFTIFISPTMATNHISEIRSSIEVSPSDVTSLSRSLEVLDSKTVSSETGNLYIVNDNRVVVTNLEPEAALIELCCLSPNLENLVENVSFSGSTEGQRSDASEDSLTTESSLGAPSKKSLFISSTTTQHSVPSLQLTAYTNPLTEEENPSFAMLERSLTGADTAAFMRTEEYKRLIMKK